MISLDVLVSSVASIKKKRKNNHEHVINAFASPETNCSLVFPIQS